MCKRAMGTHGPMQVKTCPLAYVPHSHVIHRPAESCEARRATSSTASHSAPALAATELEHYRPGLGTRFGLGFRPGLGTRSGLGGAVSSTHLTLPTKTIA